MAKIRRCNKQKEKIKKEIANAIEFCRVTIDFIKKLIYLYRKKQYAMYKNVLNSIRKQDFGNSKN